LFAARVAGVRQRQLILVNVKRHYTQFILHNNNKWSNNFFFTKGRIARGGVSPANKSQRLKLIHVPFVACRLVCIIMYLSIAFVKNCITRDPSLLIINFH